MVKKGKGKEPDFPFVISHFSFAIGNPIGR
jgi:hypothetical protein